MSEENENQPRPVEAPSTQSAPPPQHEQRQRPRRRYPRRRYSDRGNRGDNFNSYNDGAPASNDYQTGVSDPEGDRSLEGGGEGVGETGEPREPEFGEGIIEISGKGFGFLRDPKRNFIQTPQDIFVTPEIVRRFALRDGMWIYGETRRGNRGPQLIKLLKINDEALDISSARRR